MRYITLDEVIELQEELVRRTGGSFGIRDLGLLESAINQPLQQFGGVDLYPDLVAKAAAVGFFLISNHTFVDGNKRIGLASMQVVLLRNKFEIAASKEEIERVILNVASGNCKLAELTQWLRSNLHSFIGRI